jgi:hypothetical protein
MVLIPQPSVFASRAFPTARGKVPKPKTGAPISQTLPLLQSCSAPKSVSVYGFPIRLVAVHLDGWTSQQEHGSCEPPVERAG